MTSSSVTLGTGTVYHVALAADWTAAQLVGDYRMSTLGRTLDDQGYIHAAYAHQVAGVLGRFYSDVAAPLVLLTLDPADLPIVAEPAEAGGELFPHIYGPIPVGAVIDAADIRRS